MENFEKLSEQQQYEDIRKLQAKINRIEQSIEEEWAKSKINPDEISKLENLKEQKRAELKGKNQIHYLRTGDNILAASGEQGAKGADILPCPPGTRWKDILIEAIDESHIRIKTPNGERSYHYSQLKMADGRQPTKPVHMWNLLLGFCCHSGRIGSGDEIKIQNMRQEISKLNKKMGAIFGISETFTKKYKKGEGWVTRCHCTGPDYSRPLERPQNYDVLSDRGISISDEAISGDIRGGSSEDE